MPRVTTLERVQSSAALLVSLCALAVALSLHSSPAAALAPPPEKHLSPERQYVTLDQLAIYQSQIADKQIGTLELQDGAVTTAKMADGAVADGKIADGSITFKKLDRSALPEIAREITSTHVVLGEVTELGVAARGAGYTVSHDSTGEYAISFAPPFHKPPIAVVVAQSYGTCYVIAGSSDAEAAGASIRVKCMSDLLGSAPVAANTRFSFCAGADTAQGATEPEE